jgi:three-Cys-motif partner protein
MKQNDKFFAEQSYNSDIKTQIVLAAFNMWLKNNKDKKELSYIDLFAGPGLYDDGTLSTPICILQEICATRTLARKFNVVFNDHDAKLIAKLRRAILNIKNAGFLKILATSASKSENNPQIPTNGYCFAFLDFWGWKNIYKNYVNLVMQNKDCEAAIFFNFNQLSRFIRFDADDGVFDRKTLNIIKNLCYNVSKSEKEKIILEKFMESIACNGNCHCLPFKFLMNKSSRTSHYIIFMIRNKERVKIAYEQLKQFANLQDDVLCYSSKNDIVKSCR